MSKLVTKIPALVNEAKPVVRSNWNRFMHYAKVELTPPKPAEIPDAFRHAGQLMKAMKNGHWKQTTVKEAMVNTFITLEVICWFFVGEIIGKRNVIGYSVNQVD